MLQTENGEAFQIVRRRVNGAMRSGLGNLRIGAVLAGTAVKSLLPGVESADTAMDVLQRKAVHRGGVQLHVTEHIKEFHREGVIRRGTDIRFRRAGFRGKHPRGRVIRPFQRAVGKSITIQESNLIPDMAFFVHFNGQHLHSGRLDEAAKVHFAVFLFGRGTIHFGENVRFLGYTDIIAGVGVFRNDWRFRNRFFSYVRQIAFAGHLGSLWQRRHFGFICVSSSRLGSVRSPTSITESGSAGSLTHSR